MVLMVLFGPWLTLHGEPIVLSRPEIILFSRDRPLGITARVGARTLFLYFYENVQEKLLSFLPKRQKISLALNEIINLRKYSQT